MFTGFEALSPILSIGTIETNFLFVLQDLKMSTALVKFFNSPSLLLQHCFKVVHTYLENTLKKKIMEHFAF